MPDKLNTEMPWIVFFLDKQPYATSCEFGREMFVSRGHVEMPRSADFVRGAIDLRGEVLTLVDLRKWAGLPSAHDDVEQLAVELEKREQEHVEWLQELEASILEKRPFTKATDPHKCAFGKWYDNYHHDDMRVRAMLREFDAPHKAIHAIAKTAIQAAERGDIEAAQATIRETQESTLKEMVRLFGQIREAIRTSLNEVALVIKDENKACAVIVDAVESVEPLKQSFDSTAGMYASNEDIRVPWIGRRQKDDTAVLIPDVRLLFQQL